MSGITIGRPQSLGYILGEHSLWHTFWAAIVFRIPIRNIYWEDIFFGIAISNTYWATIVIGIPIGRP